MPLNWGRSLVSFEMDQLERYLDLIHASIIANEEQFYASMEEIASTLTEDDKEVFYEGHEGDFLELSEDFPRILFSSFVVSWYSFVEDHLISFCRKRNLNILISIEDNEHYGSGIRRAHKFLNRSAEYQIDNEHWRELILIGKVRNKIVQQ